jgi:hypothetical protein
MLSDDEFRDARSAYRTGEVTPALAAFVARIVRVKAQAGMLPPPPEGGPWDEDAIGEATQAWWSERLLTGDLARAFDRTSAPRGLAKYLEQALRRWLIDHQRARGLPRLLTRARKVLEEGATYRCFIPAARWVRAWWGLAIWHEPEPFQGPDREAIAASYRLGGGLEWQTDASERADSVLSTEDIGRLLSHLLESLAQLLTLEHFDAVFRHRFPGAYELAAPAMELREDLVVDPAVLPQVALERDEIARQCLAELTPRQLTMLRDRADGMTLDEIATRHRCARGTADNELRRAGTTITEVAGRGRREEALEELLRVTFEEDTDERDLSTTD